MQCSIYFFILHLLLQFSLLIAWIDDVEPYGVEYHSLRFGSQGSRHLLLPRQRPRILRLSSFSRSRSDHRSTPAVTRPANADRGDGLIDSEELVTDQITIPPKSSPA